MATRSTGITVTWGGVPFAEVYELASPTFGGVRRDRSSDMTTRGWTDQSGTVTVNAYGTTNMTSNEYGVRKTISISGGGVNLTFPAVCTGVSETPQLNGVTRYTFTAQLLDG